MARNGVRHLVDVHKLVDEDEHPRIARLPQEKRKELEIFVPIVVRDDDADTEVAPCLGLGRVLAAEPARHLRAFLIVPVHIRAVVHREQPRKVKAVHEVVQTVDDLPDTPLHGRRKPPVRGG